jgi:predicted PurR-regulated permease PerM
MWVLGIALFLWFFSAARMVVLGLLAAGCVASALHPLMRYVPGPCWARAVVVGLAPVLVLAGFVLLMSWLLAAPIQAQVQHWPEIRERMNATLAHWSGRIGLDEPVTLGGLAEQAGGALIGGGQEAFSTATSAISGVLLAMALVFFGTLYLLLDNPKKLIRPALGVMRADRAQRVEAALVDLVPRLRWWLIGTLMSMVVVGIASAVGYWIVGLNMALPLAMIAGFSEIVPTLGPAATFVLVMLFAAAQGAGAVLGVFVVYIVVQTLESYVLLPLMMRQTVNVPPIVTLFSVVLWGQVFGLPGLLLAIPIDLVIWSFVDHLLIRPRSERLAGV